MQMRTIGGLGVGLLALLLAGCSSSSSSPTTTAKPGGASSTSTTSTSTTSTFTATTGAASAQDLASQFTTAATGNSLAAFCVRYAVPSQVTTCGGDFANGQVTFKDWKVGDVTVQGTQAVITYTGTVCQGSQCASNSDPKAASNPSSAGFAGATFADAFATANNPNNQNSTPFVAAAVQQGGKWYASGF